MQINPDTRPLPPGWHQHYDSDRQSWYYVQIDVLPPKVSHTHPASLTPAPSHSETPVPVPQGEKSLSGSVTPPIQKHVPAGDKLSTAQQLYASAVNKKKSSLPGLDSEASYGPKSPATSPPPVPLSPKHVSSSSSPVFIFPDLSRGNAQQAGPTNLYNMTVVAQRGRATSSSRKANPSPSPPKPTSSPLLGSQSTQPSSPPQDQPKIAPILVSKQLDHLNKNNTNVVITRSTRLGGAPTVAMTASPPSAEQKSHPDTLTSPGLPSAHYNAPFTFLPQGSSSLTPPLSPPTYYLSGRSQRSLTVSSNAPPTQHPAPNQTYQQQYPTKQVTLNQPPMHPSSAAPLNQQVHTGSQALPPQYLQQPNLQTSSQQPIQSQVLQQGIRPGSGGHTPGDSQYPNQTQPAPQGYTTQHSQSPNQAHPGPQGNTSQQSYPGPQGYTPPNQIQPGPQGHVPQHSQPLHQVQPGLQGQAPQYNAPQYSQRPHQAQPGPQGHGSPPNQVQPPSQRRVSQHYQPSNQVQSGPQGHVPQFSQPPNQAQQAPQFSQRPNQAQQAPQFSQRPNQVQPAPQGYTPQHGQQVQPGLQGHVPQFSQPPNQAQQAPQGHKPQFSQHPNQVQPAPQGYIPQHGQPPNQVQPGPQGHAPQYSQPPSQVQPAPQGYIPQHGQPSNQVQPGPQGHAPQYSQLPSQAQPQPGLQGHAPHYSRPQVQPGLGHAQQSQPSNQVQPSPLQGRVSQYSQPLNQAQPVPQGHAAPQHGQPLNQAQTGFQGYTPQYSQIPNHGRPHLAGQPPQPQQVTQNQVPPIPPQQVPAQISYGNIVQSPPPPPQVVQQPQQLAPLQGVHNQALTSGYQPISGAAHYHGNMQQPQHQPPNQHGFSPIPQHQMSGQQYPVQQVPGVQPPPPTQHNQHGPAQAAYVPYGGSTNPTGNVPVQLGNTAPGQHNLQAPSALEQAGGQLALGLVHGFTNAVQGLAQHQGSGQHHGSAQHHASAQGQGSSQFVGIYVADYNGAPADSGPLPDYVPFDETQVTVVDTWSGDDLYSESQTTIVSDSWSGGVDDLGDSFSSFTIDNQF